MRKKVFIWIVAFAMCIGVGVILSSSIEAKAACAHTSLGKRFSEAAHPHEYFKFCNSCGEKVYVGGHATKKHGTGEWGSGTCPTCGTHTYTGRTCTTSGKCVCGATVAAMGHSYTSMVNYESAHPHRGYRLCTRCSAKSYTGTTTTREHGDGTGGTCKTCGQHKLQIVSGPQKDHPHETRLTCPCGLDEQRYYFEKTCDSCKGNMKLAAKTNSTTGVLTYIDGDMGIGTVIPVPVTYSVSYGNRYNHPADNFPTGTMSIDFATYSTTVTSLVSGQPAHAPTIITTAALSTSYYDASDKLLFTQDLHFTENGNTASKAGEVITRTDTPSYAESSAVCNILGTSNFIKCDVRAYFH